MTVLDIWLETAHVDVNLFLACTHYHTIFRFWLNVNPGIYRAGCRLFFEDCFWKG